VEVIQVKVPVLDVWARKGSMFGTVATLKDGDTLQVVEKQNDGWLRVSVGDKEGFIKETALAPPKGGGFGEAFKGMNIGRTEAADPSASMAARGIDEGTAYYVTTKNLPTDGLDEMLAAREAVVGQRFQQFITDGNVGPSSK
jgi:hypothetical protein